MCYYPTMKDINGYEGRYAITEDGRVWSYHTNKYRKLQVNKRGGYLVVGLGKPAQTFYVHRLVAAAYIQNPDNLPVVHHNDGDPTNNSVSNLDWCTYQDNTLRSAHKMRNGPLTADKVREVRGHFTNNMAETSRVTGVTYATVRDILRGQSYSWLK